MTPLSDALCDGGVAALLHQSTEFTDYLQALFEELRLHPQGDIIAALVAADHGGDRLTEDELCSTVVRVYLPDSS
jgi:cytochrome P450